MFKSFFFQNVKYWQYLINFCNFGLKVALLDLAIHRYAYHYASGGR